MQMYLISADQRAGIIAYLKSKPYAEVEQAIPQLMALPKAPEPEKPETLNED